MYLEWIILLRNIFLHTCTHQKVYEATVEMLSVSYGILILIEWIFLNF